jgi:hypothetical protein
VQHEFAFQSVRVLAVRHHLICLRKIKIDPVFIVVLGVTLGTQFRTFGRIHPSCAWSAMKIVAPKNQKTKKRQAKLAPAGVKY